MLPFLNAAVADLPGWREAWRGRADNPLALAVALSARRQAGDQRRRGNRLLLRLLLVLAVAALALLFCDLAGLLPGEAGRAFFISACAGAAAWCLAWLVGELWAGLSQAASALALPEKRAGWVQLDDLLALTTLTPQELLLGLLWQPWRALLRAALALLLLVLAIVLPVMEADADVRGLSNAWGPILSAVLLAPLSALVLFLCAALSTAGIAFYAALMNRGLTASRLLPFAGASTLLASFAWLPLSLFFYTDGAGQFNSYASAAWADAANLLLGLLSAVLTITLLGWGARIRALRVFGALLGAPAFAALHLLGWMVLGGLAMGGVLDSGASETLGLLMLAMFRGWGVLALLNPAALPSSLCLGLDLSTNRLLGGGATVPADSVSTAWWPLAYLAAGLVIAVLLARFAVLAVESRRRGEA